MKQVRYIDEEDFNDIVIDKKKTVLIDFSASWCNPCKMLIPILQSVSEEIDSNIEIYAVDVDKSFDLAKSFGVLSVPTLILFKNGLENRRIIGLKNKDLIVEMLKE